MIDVQKSLAVLGRVVKDKVTGLKGVVTSVAFDLYGCIQALVNPGVGKDGKLGEQYWLDVSRLTVSKESVMAPPEFDLGHGPEAKPIP